MQASEEEFNVVVEICVMLPCNETYDLELFERQIKLIDKISPWREVYDNGNAAPPLHFSQPFTREVRDRSVMYCIRTEPHVLRLKEHISAYVRYGDVLAKYFRQNLPSTALGVYSQIIKSWG